MVCPQPTGPPETQAPEDLGEENLGRQAAMDYQLTVFGPVGLQSRQTSELGTRREVENNIMHSSAVTCLPKQAWRTSWRPSRDGVPTRPGSSAAADYGQSSTVRTREMGPSPESFELLESRLRSTYAMISGFPDGTAVAALGSGSQATSFCSASK
jgi:hypothetical protein